MLVSTDHGRTAEGGHGGDSPEETTIFYLSKLIREYPVRLTVIARGVAFGGELEYTDGLTLGRSILARTNFELAANA